MYFDCTTELFYARFNGNDFAFRVIGGTAAGGSWINVEVVKCSNPDFIGKELCMSEDWDGGVHTLDYTAAMEWDDGFISNTDSDAFGYRPDDPHDGTGTPMGGEVVPELNGLQLKVPDRAFEPFELPKDAQPEPGELFRTEEIPWCTGDVIVLHGRAGYDAPVPFSITSFVKGVYIDVLDNGLTRTRLVIADEMLGFDNTNAYPNGDRWYVGDGYNEIAKLIHHEECGPDLIIDDNTVMFSRYESGVQSVDCVTIQHDGILYVNDYYWGMPRYSEREQ